MRKRYLVNLTVDERAALTQLVKRDRVSGLKRQRANILLKADEGLTDQEIADDMEAGVTGHFDPHDPYRKDRQPETS